MDKSSNEKSEMQHLKKKKRRKKKPIDLGEIEGLHKITLTHETQEIIGVVVGKDVTFEKPWVHIDKSKILDNELSEFSIIESSISELPREDVSLVYIPDDERDYDEFYIATTESAIDTATILLNKQKEEQEKKLYHSIHRPVKPWLSLGSGAEVEEEIPRRTRPLMQVEIQTGFPLRRKKGEFQTVTAEEIEHGYVELGTDMHNAPEVIPKRRTNIGIQITPVVTSNQAQTLLLYPENAVAQYHYELDPDREHPIELLEKIRRYIEDHYLRMQDMFQVNYYINFYTDDYNMLVPRDETVQRFNKTIKDAVEYRTFYNTDMCKDKVISSVAWHGHWPNIVGVAYSDTNRRIHTRSVNGECNINREIYGYNPVLIWHTSNYLTPKLILETTREVTTLSFCPFDENILLGGCVNGQIVIWNLKDRLGRVEEEEKSNFVYFTHRSYMYLLMGWKRDMIASKYVPVVASSDLKFSHHSTVVSIRWLPKTHKITNIGGTIHVDKSEDHYPQISSAGEGGTICIWDLEEDLNTIRMEPSTQEIKSNMGTTLHMKLRPIFRVDVKDILGTSIPASVSSFIEDTVSEIPKDENEDLDLYATEPSVPKLRTSFFIGTLKGEFKRVTWESLDLDASDPVNSQVAHVTEYSLFHDGPITSLQKSSICDVILSTGGRVFALWTNELKGKPLFWRKLRDVITFGCFNQFQPSSIIILTSVGFVEVWDICLNSKAPEVITRLSNNPLTEICFQPESGKEFSTGVTDAYGCLRIYVNLKSHYELKDETAALKSFIEREQIRKQQLLKWQSDKYGINKPKPSLSVLLSKQHSSARRGKVDDLVARKLSQVRFDKSKLIQQVEQREKRKKEINEKEEMRQLIISKKKIDPEELAKQRTPLQILEEEHQKKIKKMKLTQRASAKIYSNKISSEFPKIVEPKTPPEPDPYAGGYSDTEKAQCFENYRKIEQQAKQFMKDNPLTLEFNKKNVIMNSRMKRAALKSSKSIDEHRTRHQNYKSARDGSDI